MKRNLRFRLLVMALLTPLLILSATPQMASAHERGMGYYSPSVHNISRDQVKSGYEAAQKFGTWGCFFLGPLASMFHRVGERGRSASLPVFSC